MQYKTIVLELIQQQQPELHDQLRASRALLSTMERYALELKASHEEWMDRLSQRTPRSDRSQFSSEALEIALKELEEDLCSGSKTDEDGPTLVGAMGYLKRHTPTA
jgi:hypothetical protein